MAVGQDADPETGWPLGLQLSLFDVSDSHDPRLLGAFGGEPGAFPVRVIPIGQRLYVFSWGADHFLLQQFSPPARIAGLGRFLEQDRIRVYSDSGEPRDDSDC